MSTGDADFKLNGGTSVKAAKDEDVRITIRMEQSEVTEMDSAIESAGYARDNRSAFIRNAVRYYIEEGLSAGKAHSQGKCGNSAYSEFMKAASESGVDPAAFLKAAATALESDEGYIRVSSITSGGKLMNIVIGEEPKMPEADGREF